MANKLNLAQAARQLGVSAETLRWRVREGGGPPCLIIPGLKRDIYRFDMGLLDRWATKHTTEPRGSDGTRHEPSPAISKPLSLTSAARRLGVSAEVLRWRVRRGNGPPCLIITGLKRSVYRIDADALDAWIADQTSGED